MSYILGFTFILYACEKDEIPSKTGSFIGLNNQWDIPLYQVFDGGPGKDGIPALENPNLINAAATSYLSDKNLVLGYKNGNEMIAYPHPILDWHEIINDKVNEHAFAVTYCPLTGTGIGWERTIEGDETIFGQKLFETTFGVSGLIYNSNLIPYDRITNSKWSQIKLKCVNGALKGSEIQTFTLVETTWESWKSMYPATLVVSTQTGYSRNYDRYPYGDYKTNNDDILFPLTHGDDRLDSKERVHGIIIDEKAKAYRFETFAENTKLIKDEFRNIPLLIVGNKERNFIVSFERRLEDGTELNFSIASEQEGASASPIVLEDNEGNKWNIFGEAVSGPRTGQKLNSTTSFLGYWFSWEAFYPGIEIF